MGSVLAGNQQNVCVDGVRMDGLVLDGRYRIGQQLGEGGMGAVYEAQDLRLERVVAVKLLHGVSLRRDPRARQRFEREAKLLAGLTSPFIVTVHDAGEAPAVTEGGQRLLYLVMERLHGRSLDDTIAARELPPLRLLVQWGEQICRALGVAHDSGVIHRDLKPANVMVGTDGLVRVLDFGIAAVVADSSDNHRLTSTGLVVGTPAYMAPEQIEGQRFEKRTDLYALGCILYALVTGRPPFESDSLYTLMRQQMTRLPEAPSMVRPGVPNEWDALILRLLAKQPEERPESAAEVLELLAHLPCPEVPAPARAAGGAAAAGDAGEGPEAGQSGQSGQSGEAGGSGARGYAPTTVDPRLAVLTPSVGTTIPLPEPEPGPRPEAVPVPGARPAAEAGAPRAGVLQPGGRSGPLPGEAQRLTVRITWSPQPGPAMQPEVDASAFVVDGPGEVLSDLHFVFYNNVGAPDQSVWLDAPEPGANERQVGVSIPQFPAKAQRVVLALSIHAAQERGHHTGLLRRLTVRVSDADSGVELCGYRMPTGAPNASAMTVGELYRGPGGWGFHAASCGYLGGLLEIAQTYGINAG